MQARKLAAAKQRYGSLPDGGKSVGISVGASMLVASLAGCVNVLLTNPIWCVCKREKGAPLQYTKPQVVVSMQEGVQDMADIGRHCARFDSLHRT
jgi:hypothetical protein